MDALGYVAWTGSIDLRPSLGHRADLFDRHAGQLLIWLYPLAIIVASILFSREATFIVAGLSFILLGGLAELIYYNVLPRTQVAVPSGRQLQTWILSNLFYFMAVAYLSSLLAQSLRRQGAELEVKRGELQDLQAFNQDIIHSMRVVCSLPIWMGEFYYSTGQARKLQDTRSPRFAESPCRIFGRSFGSRETWPKTANCLRGAKWTFSHQMDRSGSLEFGFPPSHWERRTTGYVFNFQDLTDLRHLEREVATKDRMAALGRLSAAIAHEIRQPLTAMAGAVKELAARAFARGRAAPGRNRKP